MDATTAFPSPTGPEPVPMGAGPASTPPESGVSTTRVLLRVALALALVIAVWFLYLLGEDVQAADFALVDTSKARLLSGATWADPRWEAELAAKLAALGKVANEDDAALQRVVSVISGLPFVAEVARPKVLWPDGLRLDVRLRTPIACVQIGSEFQPVAEDGYLLTGRWPAPPERGAGWLPVVVVGASVERLHAGPVVWTDAAVDGFAVAQSLWESLEPRALAELGRIVIDARNARSATVENGGVTLALERGRRVLFGRAPNTDEPGELPVAQKWKNLDRALHYLEPIDDSGERAGTPQFDWELVDVRWDMPEILPRGGFAKDDPRSKPRLDRPADERARDLPLRGAGAPRGE
ncbi:MAG: hypothetical protein L6Q99_21825 [Planctomycetes bacterium]|nr:hypothetical protein [Planctomycetota bacterium]